MFRKLIVPWLAAVLLAVLPLGQPAGPANPVAAPSVVRLVSTALPDESRLCLPCVTRNVAWTPFYRLRLRVTTTSDWSWVILTQGASVLASVLSEMQGGSACDGGGRFLGLFQPLTVARRGGRVSVTRDLAVADLGEHVELEITRGGLGETTVEVWNANGEVPLWISSGAAREVDTLTLQVDARAIRRGGPLTHGVDEMRAAGEEAFSRARQAVNALPELRPLFHRVRIKFSSTSDWASISVVRGATVYSALVASTEGSPTSADADSVQLSLDQPLERAVAGSIVALEADLALADTAEGGGVAFRIAQGSIGDVTMEVSNHNGPVAVAVKSVTRSGLASPADPFGPVTTTVSADALAADGPLEAAKPGVPKMVWAFYYPWYNETHWSSSILRDRPETPYASNDPQAVERHIQQAQSAGIDGFISSWWGPGDYSDANLELLLDAAAARGFSVTVYLETLGEAGPRDEAQLLAWLQYLLHEHGQHPAYYRLQGKPLVVVWASGSVPLDAWQRIFAQLKASDSEAAYVAMGYKPIVLSEFTGVHEYGVFGHYGLGILFQHAARELRAFSLLHPDVVPRVWIATLQPGYDERNLPDRMGLYWERRGGDAYRYTFEAEQKSDPDWLFITSWNEWPEHTYIEPSEQYGDLYLRLTKEFADRWKKS
jgi:hypothetical protein